MTASRSSAPRVRRLLRGYRGDGDSLVERYELHLDAGALTSIVGAQPDDPYLVHSYPLSIQQVEALAAMTGLQLDPTRLDYFLEAVAG